MPAKSSSQTDPVPPPIVGVVLAGGESKRMGLDKSKIMYRNECQELYTARLLDGLTDSVVISKRYSTPNEMLDYTVVTDLIKDGGPLGAIYSVQKAYPGYALLVVACDLPLLTRDTLSYLIASRNPDMHATAIQSVGYHKPEPLLTIYEPSTFNLISQYVSKSIASPSKLLSVCNVHRVAARDERTLLNANTPDDVQQAKKIINTENKD